MSYLQKLHIYAIFLSSRCVRWVYNETYTFILTSVKSVILLMYASNTLQKQEQTHVHIVVNFLPKVFYLIFLVSSVAFCFKDIISVPVKFSFTLIHKRSDYVPYWKCGQRYCRPDFASIYSWNAYLFQAKHLT